MKKEKEVELTGDVMSTLEAFRQTKTFLVSQGHTVTFVSFDIYERSEGSSNYTRPTLTIRATCDSK